MKKVLSFLCVAVVSTMIVACCGKNNSECAVDSSDASIALMSDSLDQLGTDSIDDGLTMTEGNQDSIAVTKPAAGMRGGTTGDKGVNKVVSKVADVRKPVESSEASAMQQKVSQAHTSGEYSNLGLPSGTMWCSHNVDGLFSYDEAVAKFGSGLPTRAQWEELKTKCQWSWNGKGYKITGPNGNYIFLPAAGYRFCNGNLSEVGTYGFYCSSVPSGSDNAWYFYFNSSSAYMYNFQRCGAYSVRLVQN